MYVCTHALPYCIHTHLCMHTFMNVASMYVCTYICMCAWYVRCGIKVYVLADVCATLQMSRVEVHCLHMYIYKYMYQYIPVGVDVLFLQSYTPALWRLKTRKDACHACAQTVFTSCDSFERFSLASMNCQGRFHRLSLARGFKGVLLGPCRSMSPRAASETDTDLRQVAVEPSHLPCSSLCGPFVAAPGPWNWDPATEIAISLQDFYSENYPKYFLIFRNACLERFAYIMPL